MADDPPFFVAITRKMPVAPGGLEPTHPKIKDFKSGEARSISFHGMLFSPPVLEKRAVVPLSRSTDLRALGYTLATLLSA